MTPDDACRPMMLVRELPRLLDHADIARERRETPMAGSVLQRTNSGQKGSFPAGLAPPQGGNRRSATNWGKKIAAHDPAAKPARPISVRPDQGAGLPAASTPLFGGQ